MAIVLVGLVVLVWAMSPTERKRRSMVRQLGVGADTAQVLRLVGAPLRCAPGSLEHLRGSFPADWAPVAVERALERMRAETAQRWVYPLSLRRRGSCTAGGRRTEIGVDRGGRVLWSIPVTGKDLVRLPDAYQPSGVGG